MLGALLVALWVLAAGDTPVIEEDRPKMQGVHHRLLQQAPRCCLLSFSHCPPHSRCCQVLGGGVHGSHEPLFAVHTPLPHHRPCVQCG
ncbi:hypothetical protein OEZ85_002218 [Tetradesmus obliquus]|uniref:Uncharacterized protein n=1 Tax=Tetradesmus obliquus TaxID=3088 RepID=A0ABY8U563_TETOB|nr:hypothetical protein OEZ85_002218 [Tetradesmus obliquus]